MGFFFFSSRRRHTRCSRDWSSDVCSSDLVGLAPNKVIAKLASKWKKPSGLTAIPARDIHLYLKDLDIEKVWGIGPQTAAYLRKFGIKTALDFARKPEDWVRNRMTKPHVEIWQELN